MKRSRRPLHRRVEAWGTGRRLRRPARPLRRAKGRSISCSASYGASFRFLTFDTCPTGKRLDEPPDVEKLLARDHVILDRVETDFVVGDARAAGFGGEVDREVDGEAAGARAGV